MIEHLVNKAEEILNSYKAELESNRKEGRTSDWTQDANRVTAEKYRRLLKDNSNNLNYEIYQARKNNRYEYEQARKFGFSKDKAYHLQNAALSLGGDLNAAVERIFPRLMENPDCRDYRFIYEDYLHTRIEGSAKKDVVLQAKADEMFRSYRSEKEMEYVNRGEYLEKLNAHAATIDGAAWLRLEEIEQGEPRAEMKLLWTWEQLTEDL